MDMVPVPNARSARPFLPSEFEREGYNAKDFIIEKRKKTQLPQLQRALSDYSTEIHNTLVELINAKYSDFVSLSAQMVNVDKHLDEIQNPIRENHTFSKEFSDEIKQSIATMREHLNERKQIARKKKHIQNLMEIKETLKKAEESLTPSDDYENDFMKTYLGSEIVGFDLKKIYMTCNRDDASDEMKSVLEKADALKEQVLKTAGKHLRELFPEVQKEWKADGPKDQLHDQMVRIAHLTRAMVALGENGQIEQLVSELFVLPQLDKILNEVVVPPASGVGEADKKLEGFLSGIVKWLKEGDSAMMWLVQHLTSYGNTDDADVRRPYFIATLHLLCNSVMKCSLEHIEKHFPNVFSMSSNAGAFVTNYRRCRDFIGDISRIMTSGEQQYFQKTGMGGAFMAKWKTQVYFVMRQNEHFRAIDAVTNVATAGDGSADAKAPTAGIEHCNFTATAVILEQLTLLWDDRYYLDLLFSKCLRLSLEMIGRYSDFMQKVLSSHSSESEVAMRLAADISVVERCLAPHEKIVTNIITRLDPRSHSSVAWSASHEKQFLKAKSNIISIFEDSVKSLTNVRGQVEKTIVEATTAEASKQFSGLRGVAGLYRMQNKPAPTRASPYVEAALRGVRVLNTDWQGPKESIEVVLDSCCNSFAEALSVEMTSLERQEKSLKKFAKGDSAPPTADGKTLSDMDKIQIQLHIDVDTFLKEAKLLRGNTADTPAEERLKQVVQPIAKTYDAYLATLN